MIRYCSLVVAALLAGVVCAQGTPDSTSWSYQSQEDIGYFEMTGSGDLFVSTKSEISLVSGRTGHVVWSRPDIRKCRQESYYVSCRYMGKYAVLHFYTTPYATLKIKDDVILIDLSTGKTLFDSKNYVINEVLAYYAASFEHQLVLYGKLANGNYALASIRLGDSGPQNWLREVNITKDLLLQPQAGVDPANVNRTALVYGKDGSGRRVLAELDYATSEILWTRNDLLRSDVKWPLPFTFIRDSETTLITWLDNGGPMRLGPGGKLLWRCTQLAGRKPTEMALRNGVLYIVQKGDVFALDPADGGVLWKHDAKSYYVESVVLHPRGLLSWQGAKLQLLDFESGRAVWPKEAQMPDGWSQPDGQEAPRLIRDDVVYLAGKKMLAMVDLADGHVAEVCRFEFEGGDAPQALESIGDGLLLFSSNNFLKIDGEGREEYHRYYKSPGLSFWEKVAVGAATTLSRNAGADRPFMPFGFHTTTDAEQFSYIYFEDDKVDGDNKFGLARLDKATGEEKGRIVLDERHPKYFFDTQAERFFYKDNDKIIRSMQFEPLKGGEN